MTDYHIPVLLQETIKQLKIQPNGIYVDVTFGGGGHSRAILDKLEEGRLFSFDKDPDAQANIPDDPRITFIPHDFRYLKNQLRFHGVRLVDGIIADLGVSSYQFDTEERGFTIRANGPLDMRMNSKVGKPVHELLVNWEEEEIADILYMYGEFRNSRALARKIVQCRSERPLLTVEDLKSCLASFAPRNAESKFYARVFQAFRIEVNDEIGALRDMLQQSHEVLHTGGRIAVISYHSLEDRLVKNFFREGKLRGEADRDFYGNRLVPFKALSSKPIVASEEELKRNPRSRSARLRVAERISV
jgi:16S rRNA (cytosine1402-N4)-methyltransferase